jgi:amidase
LVHDNGMGVQPSIPPVTTICSVSREEVVIPLDSVTVRLPARPFVGTIGVAPKRERRMTLSQSPDYVGDIDLPDLTTGSTLHVKVHHPGGLLSLGDVHAVQGEGEFAGIAVEVDGLITVRIDVTRANESVVGRLPLLSDGTKFGAIAAFQGTPTTSCIRAAAVELTQILVRLGMSLQDALQYLSVAAKVRIGNMFEPFYSTLVFVERDTVPVALPAELEAN